MASPGEQFLNSAGISKEECHLIAEDLTSSDDIAPIRHQGGLSYTLRGGDIVVQFRAAQLDLSIHAKAMVIHGTRYILPITCKQSAPFYVYTSPYGGRSCCAEEFRVSVPAQKNAITDLATFLAQSCQHPVDHMDVKLDLIKRFLTDCLDLPGLRGKVQNLLDNLGMVFVLGAIADILEKLADLPVVLVHGDLGTTNILTDNDGHITGILDWDGSQFLPFGWNFYGVEMFLGDMSFKNGEFSYVDNKARAELEIVFWDTFWEKAPLEMKQNRQNIQDAIKISRGIGVLWQYVGPEQGVGSFLEGFSHFMPIIETVL